MLSAASVLERSISTTSATDKTSFSTVVATTQLFVDAFNNFLQSDSLQNSQGASIGSQFVQALNSQVSSGTSILDRLSGIGINYQVPSIQNVTGQLTIDLNALQSAYNSDHAGTISILAQATQSIGQFAAAFTGHLVQMDILTQISNSQAAASNYALLPAFSQATIPSVAASSATAQGTTEAAALFGAALTGAVSASTTADLILAAGEAAALTPAVLVTGNPVTATGVINAIAAAGEAVAATGVPAASTLGEATVTAAATTSGETVTATAAVAAAAALPVATPAVAGAATTAIPDGTADTTAIPVTAVATPAIVAQSPVTTASPAATAPSGAEAASATAGAPMTVAGAATSTAAGVLPAGNLLVDASNPAVAAAIAAYHMVDGIFDTAWPHDEGITPASDSYSATRPVSSIQAAKLNLHA